MIDDAFGEHPAVELEAFANESGIAVFEMLDHHEDHSDTVPCFRHLQPSIYCCMFRQSPTTVRHNEEVKEAQRQTLLRRPDEPKLEIGDVVPIKEGVVGVVLARFMPSGDESNEVHYIVELRSDEE